MGPESIDYRCPYKRKGWGLQDAQRKKEHHMEMQGESRVTIGKPRNVKDCQSPGDLGEEHRADSPSEPPEGTNPAHPGMWFSGLHNCEKVNFCYLKPLGLWQFVIAALGNEY